MTNHVAHYTAFLAGQYREWVTFELTPGTRSHGRVVSVDREAQVVWLETLTGGTAVLAVALMRYVETLGPEGAALCTQRRTEALGWRVGEDLRWR
jgi:hypothetical protein